MTRVWVAVYVELKPPAWPSSIDPATWSDEAIIESFRENPAEFASEFRKGEWEVHRQPSKETE